MSSLLGFGKLGKELIEMMAIIYTWEPGVLSPIYLLEVKLACTCQLKLSCHSNHLNWIVFPHLKMQMESVLQQKDLGIILAGVSCVMSLLAVKYFTSLCFPPWMN